MKIEKWDVSLFLILFLVLFSPAVYGADKEWNNAGDGTTWADGQNWNPQGIPSIADNITIDYKDVSVTCDKTFGAKSITVGGITSSTLTKNDFISGTISPSLTSDDALHIRKNGLVSLKGIGTLTLKGKFKSTSEEGFPGEESFMFTLE